MYGSWEGEKSRRNASHWKVHPGGQVHRSQSLSKSKLCVRNQSTPHQLDRWRDRSYLLTLLRPDSAQRYILFLHYLLLGSNWNSLFHTTNIYFCLLLSQCSLSDVTVAQQHQNVSFPMLWGIHRPGYQNSLPSWAVPQSIPTPTQHCSGDSITQSTRKEKCLQTWSEEKSIFFPEGSAGGSSKLNLKKTLVTEGFAF